MTRIPFPRRPSLVAGAVILLAWCWGAGAAIRTVPRGRALGSEAVRQALSAPTEEGRIEALIRVLQGKDLPAAFEAVEVLASMGPRVVPRLVTEMHRTRNNWLIGATLVRMGSAAVVPLIELLEQADEATAVDCIYLLGAIRDRRAVPMLIRYLEDPRRKVRMYAVTSLLQIGGPRAVEAVLARLTREGAGLSGYIQDSLIRFARKDVEPVIQSLTSPDPRVRRETAYLLGELGDPRAVEPLARLLDDPDPVVRKNACYALGALAPDTEDPGWVVQALVARLGDPDGDVAEQARCALVRFGRAAVDALVEACRKERTDVVVRALNALRDIGSSEAEPVMIDLLTHPDQRVRIAAVSGLVEVGTARAVEPLLQALRDEDLQWFASLALERVGVGKPDLFFATLPNDPTMSLRIQILVRLGSAVVPFLVEQLNARSTSRRAAACWVLGEIGDPSAADDLARLLDDPQVGWLAARSLHRMGRAGLDALRRYLRSAPGETGAVNAVEGIALFQDPEAWTELERAVQAGIPRAARVLAAVRISERGDPVQVARLRSYLDGEGADLWLEVEKALRRAATVR